MTQTVAIPGRRISQGETLYTDWVSRGGDCILLRAEGLVKSSSTGTVVITVWTRGEDGDTITQVTSTSNGDVEIDNFDEVFTALYLATTTGGGCKEEIRLKIEFKNGSAGDFYVIRVFPPIFFDSAKEY